MRKILSLLAVLALAGCGGGGGGSTPTSPTPIQSVAPPSGSLVTPTFTLVLGPTQERLERGAQAAVRQRHVDAVRGDHARQQQRHADDGVPADDRSPTSTAPAETRATRRARVNGPPSPPGTDRYTVGDVRPREHDQRSPLVGNVLSTATKDFTIVAGSGNTGLTITLFGVVESLTIGAPGAPNAGTTPADATLSASPRSTQPAARSPARTATTAPAAGLRRQPRAERTPVTLTIPKRTHRRDARRHRQRDAEQHHERDAARQRPTSRSSSQYAGLAENPETITAAATRRDQRDGELPADAQAPVSTVAGDAAGVR